MTNQPVWINKRALLLLHEESLSIFGGARGMRDEGLLDSALARPLNLFHYRPESIFAELAASYAFGLSRNHPFLDGNKRIAFLSIGLFLAANGYKFRPGPADAIRAIVSLASGELDEANLSMWIAINTESKLLAAP